MEIEESFLLIKGYISVNEESFVIKVIFLESGCCSVSCCCCRCC